MKQVKWLPSQGSSVLRSLAADLNVRSSIGLQACAPLTQLDPSQLAPDLRLHSLWSKGHINKTCWFDVVITSLLYSLETAPARTGK